jgi:L-rhamnose mutarotase
MLEVLQRTGWHNYSLFAQDNGDITGYLECEDFAASKAAMAELAINAEWQREMADLFVGLDDAMPDEAMEPITEIFHLD